MSGRMEHGESKTVEVIPTVCKGGCGFFGAPSQQDFCSTCYKKEIEKQNGSSTENTASTAQTPSNSNASSTQDTEVPSIADDSDASLATSAPSMLPAQQTVPSLEQTSYSRTVEAAPAPESESPSPDVEKSIKPKRNRCASCKKKIGLTGLSCRCGGLYCAVHRYSDKHDCSFDYRSLGAQEIKANNPVTIGEKVNRI